MPSESAVMAMVLLVYLFGLVKKLVDLAWVYLIVGRWFFIHQADINTLLRPLGSFCTVLFWIAFIPFFTHLDCLCLATYPHSVLVFGVRLL